MIQSHPLLSNNTHMLIMIRSQGMYALFKEDAHGGVNATAQASSGTGRARAVPYRPLRAGTAPSSVKVMCFGVASTLFGPEHSGRFARICMHVYVYMYVCVCVYVYIFMYLFVYMSVCMCVCIYTTCFGVVSMLLATSIPVGLYACMQVRICMCVCVCVCMYV